MANNGKAWAAGVLSAECQEHLWLWHQDHEEVEMSTTIAQLAAAVGTSGTVLVLLWQERVRRQEARLERIITTVLTPIQETLESYAGFLARTSYPLTWRHPEGLILDPRPGPFPRIQFGATDYGESAQDAHLYAVAYNSVKRQRPYRHLINDWETFEEEHEQIQTDLLALAKDAERTLRASCTLPDISVDYNSSRNCAYGQLALYVFNRTWLAHYEIELLEEACVGNPAHWKLRNVAASTEYTNGTTREETAQIKTVITELISDNSLRERAARLQRTVETLDGRRGALLGAIAEIRWDRM